MNYVFISPHFPHNFKNFAVALKEEGITVLGIGSEPYEALEEELKSSLTDYYRVEDMEDYDQMYRALGFLIFRHGRMDYLESHNEYWLEQDARLRTDFNIPGFRTADMPPIKLKSEMKRIFRKAGIPVARGRVIHTLEEARALGSELGYPMVAKPDNGVGAAHTYKIRDEADLDRFFQIKPDLVFIMEEFIQGDIETFDGLVDQSGELVFKNSFQYTLGVMEIVNHQLDLLYYTRREIPEDLHEYGMAAVRAFGLAGRFFHLEFFRLPDGSLMALELNARPPGGQSLDMFNYANDTDVYRRYAAMISGKSLEDLPDFPYFCAYIGLQHKEGTCLCHSSDEVRAYCGDLILQHNAMPAIFARAMGNEAYLIRTPDLDRMLDAADFIMKREEQTTI